MSGQGQTMPPKGPPYAPQIWGLGGKPSIIPDEPITAIFLFLFILSAIAHMTIFQLNQRKGHKFLMSGLLFGFSMARIATTTLRLISIRFPTDVPLAIAAQIFVAAGVLILFVVNLIFAQRMIRAAHPNLGWHRFFSWVFKVIYALIVVMIIAVITVTVQSFYTLSPNIRRIDRDIQLTGVTYFMVVSFLPIPMVIFGLLIPRRQKLDKFGAGRWRTKVIILLMSSILVCFGAAYRCGTSYLTPVPRTQPVPAYFNKAAFYIVNFTIEWVVLAVYAILRVDQRFHIPNGARGPGSYSVQQPESRNRKSLADTVSTSGGYAGQERSPVQSSGEHQESLTKEGSSRFSLPRVFSEEETFGNAGDESAELREKNEDVKDVEAGAARY